jgi:hypothetical protein
LFETQIDVAASRGTVERSARGPRVACTRPQQRELTAFVCVRELHTSSTPNASRAMLSKAPGG